MPCRFLFFSRSKQKLDFIKTYINGPLAFYGKLGKLRRRSSHPFAGSNLAEAEIDIFPHQAGNGLFIDMIGGMFHIDGRAFHDNIHLEFFLRRGNDDFAEISSLMKARTIHEIFNINLSFGQIIDRINLLRKSDKITRLCYFGPHISPAVYIQDNFFFLIIGNGTVNHMLRRKFVCIAAFFANQNQEFINTRLISFLRAESPVSTQILLIVSG